MSESIVIILKLCSYFITLKSKLYRKWFTFTHYNSQTGIYTYKKETKFMFKLCILHPGRFVQTCQLIFRFDESWQESSSDSGSSFENSCFRTTKIQSRLVFHLCIFSVGITAWRIERSCFFSLQEAVQTIQTLEKASDQKRVTPSESWPGGIPHFSFLQR